MCPLRPPQRLQAVAEAIPARSRSQAVADIATGRAELAIHLAVERICPKVIAVDRSPRAVAAARDAVVAAGLSDRIEVRLGDGLSAVSPLEAGTIVIAGVGARLLIRMLARVESFLQRGPGLPESVRSGGPVIVLQPMSEARLLRDWCEHTATGYGYCLDERLVRDGGRFYHVFVLTWPEPGSRGEAGPAAGDRRTRCATSWQSILPEAVVAEIGLPLLVGPDRLLPDYLEWRARALTNLARAAGAVSSVGGTRVAGDALVLAGLMQSAARMLREGPGQIPGEGGWAP